MLETRNIALTRLGLKSRIRGDYMICAETSGNGAKIGMPHIQPEFYQIRAGRNRDTSGYDAAAAGKATRIAARLHAVRITPLTDVMTESAFE